LDGFSHGSHVCVGKDMMSEDEVTIKKREKKREQVQGVSAPEPVLSETRRSDEATWWVDDRAAPGDDDPRDQGAQVLTTLRYA